MAAEVIPEVKEKEAAEQKRRQDEKRLMAKQLAVGSVSALADVKPFNVSIQGCWWRWLLHDSMG